MKKLIIAAVFVLAAASGVKAAGMEVGKMEVGFGPGIAIPMNSDYKDGNKSSFMLDLYGQYQIHEMLALGLDMGYDFGHKSKTTGFEDAKLKILQITPFVKFEQPFDLSGKKATYFAKLGVGYYNLRVPSFSDSTGTPYDSTNVGKLGFNLGLGATMEVAPQFAVGLDVTYHYVTCSDMVQNDASERKPLTQLTPAIHGIYRF